MALQENKAEPKAKGPVKTAPLPNGAEKSESKAKGPVKAAPLSDGAEKSKPKAKNSSAETVSGAKAPEESTPALKGVQPGPNDTGQDPPAAAPTTGVTSGSFQNLNQTNPAGPAPSEDKLTGSSGDGYGMYILLGLLLGLFGYLWAKGHLQSLRKYVMETREQLRKCTWPTRDELYQHTVVVFLSTLMMGVFVVVADQVAALVVWDMLLQVPTSVFGKLLG